MTGVMSRFLNRLFTRPPTAALRRQTIEAAFYRGSETLEVVGESHYQDSLWEIVGGRCAEPIRYETQAVLCPDPDNDYDSNAIEVRIDGRRVGHLSRRSEEHTSELQSRENLVCRLL